jgi:hypothetical protein
MYDDIAARYLDFAQNEARGVSPSFEVWANGVAADEQVLARLATLDARQQQPNLVFAAARLRGAQPGGYETLREALLTDWERITAVIRSRSTQTNEANRCAVLLPLLAQLPGPLALLEVGAAAGLCLYPDRYSYRYSNGVHLDPSGGRSEVVLRCAVSGPAPLPLRLPEVVWRAGIDLNPLDPLDPDAMQWLETLVWPEQEDRRARLRAALEIARADPAEIERGDLNELLPSVASKAPADATLVVFHSAVLNYLEPADRQRFIRIVGDLPGHWISNEGRGVGDLPVPDIAVTPETPFVVALDGQPRALASAHGRALTWLT